MAEGVDLILPGGPGFLVPALLWWVIPVTLSALIARARGFIVGPAILLGVIGGWLGLVVVLIFYRALSNYRSPRSRETHERH